MAPETKQKKRKAAAPAPSPTAKKSKKATSSAAVSKPFTGMSTRSSSRSNAVPRSKAADFMSDGSDSEDGGWAALEAKKPKGKNTPAVEKPTAKAAAKEKGGKSGKKGKKDGENGVVKTSGKSTEEETISLYVPGDVLEADDSAGESVEEEIDDQTATLLKGFESSDEEEDDDSEVPTAKQMAGAKIPDEKKTKKRIGDLAVRDKSTPGVLYLGRIPHGFYEQEMRSYFSQFGTVTRLRLSRNKKTGHSRHFAFIEFADTEVAKIAAETMDNYLLFGHILKCKPVPRDDLEFIEKLFRGSGKKFKPRPGAKLHQRVLERKRTSEEWEKEMIRETSRRKYVNEKLKKKGIDYEFEAPEVKKPDPMEIDETHVAVVEETVTVATIEEAVPEKIVPEKKKGEKGKRTAEGTLSAVIEETATIVVAEEAFKVVPKEVVPEKKGKKGKKGKKTAEATPTAATTVAVEEAPEEAVPEKKKGKKGRRTTEAAPTTVIEETIAVAAVDEAIPEKKKGKRGKKIVKAASAAVIEETAAVATVEEVAPEKVAPEKKKGRKGKKTTEATPSAVIEGAATIAAAEEALEKTVSEKKKKGKKGKKDVAISEEVAEMAVEMAVEAVAEDDGIDELQTQTVVKKTKSKSKAKLPVEVKTLGRVTRKSAAKKSKA